MLHRTKHWIAVVGSPRRGENTERLVDVIAEALAENSIVVKKFYLDQGQMSPCTNCEYCMQTGNCLIDDEITEILQAIKTADGIILASPSYNYNVTAQMKVLLDRSFVLNDYTDSLWRSRVPAGKKAILAGVCKGKTEESMGYTLEAMRKS
ncbi:MAG: flavodoxin family protein, partial [Clostridia bacterium]|nr:flavodoxin family protein [Clostridia bacterium]